MPFADANIADELVVVGWRVVRWLNVGGVGEIVAIGDANGDVIRRD